MIFIGSFTVGYWHSMNDIMVHNQQSISQYLTINSGNGTRIYYLSGLWSISLIYMGFNDPSRFYDFGPFLSCKDFAKNSYVILPDYNYSLNYTPNPQIYCPNWAPVLPANQTDCSVNSYNFVCDNLYYIK